MTDPIPEGMLEVQGSGNDDPIIRAKKDDNTTVLEVDPNERVGIIVEEPTHTLDVNGQARVRDLPAGTLEYDNVVADTDGVLHRLSSVVGKSGRWTSTDIASNINVTGYLLPLFATEDFNDGPFSINAANTIQIDEAGVYRLGYNVTIRNASGSRNNPIAHLYINTVAEKLYAATGYTRNYSGHQVSSLNYATVRKFNAGDTISVGMFREASSGIVRLADVAGAEFWIEKAR